MASPRAARKAAAPDPTSADTKTRILDAAEILFMEHGFEATSLRSLTTAAGVNLAAVNYHFGTKEELFQAVLTRRLDPMNQERIELLAALERHAAARGTRSAWSSSTSPSANPPSSPRRARRSSRRC